MKIRFSIFFICALNLITSGCSDPQREAESLFREATAFIKSAGEYENRSYSDAYSQYRKVLDNIEKILSDYESTKIAVDLKNGTAKIDKVTLRDFRQDIFPLAMKRARAEENPGYCAFIIMKTMKDTSFKDTTLSTIAKKFADRGEFDDATETMKTIENDYLRLITLAYMAVKYAQTDNQDDARKTVAEIERGLEGVTDPYCGAKLRDSVAEIHALLGDSTAESNWLREAARTSEDISSTYSRVSVMTETAVLKSKGKMKQESPETLSEAFELADTVENIVTRVKLYGDIAQAYDSIEHQNDATGVFRKAVELVQTQENPLLKADALQEIAVKSIETGRETIALETVARAAEIVESLENTEDKNRILGKIAAVYALIEHFEKAMDIAETIDNAQTKTGTLAEIAEAYIRAGKCKEALDTALHALNSARNIQGNVFKDLSVFEIAGKYTECLEYEKSLRIARTINSATLKFLAITNLALKIMETETTMPDNVKSVMYHIIKELESKKEFDWSMV